MDSGNSPHPGRLIVRHDLQLVAAIELDVDSLTIGRSSRCDVTLEHDAVSRIHARMEKRQDGWYIVDRQSANGVLVNGRKETEAHLAPGDVIEIRPFAINYLGGETSMEDRSIRLAESSLTPTIVRDLGRPTQDVKQRLDDLYALSRMVIRRRDNGSFWQKVHVTLQRALSADRCVLVGVDESAGIYRLAPRARPTDSNTPLELSRSVLNEVIESGKGLLIQSVSTDDRFAAAPSLSLSGVGSVICAPVVVGGRTRAVVYADRHHAQPPFEDDDLEFVMAATAVDSDELHAKSRELARIRGRIETAREMQEMLLPQPMPQPTWGQVAARNYPADQMSGDIYDAFIDASGRLVLSIADVTGHGVPAAFVTAILQDALRQSTDYLDDLGKIIQRINASISAYRRSGCFATMVLCRWSPAGDHVEIANAGHHAPLWVDANGKVDPSPEAVGMLLGFDATWDGEIVQRDVSSDVALLLSSDGATEARDQAGNEYGLARLGEQVAEARGRDAETVVAGLLDDVQAHCSPNEPKDDVTLLVVKRTT